MATSTTKSAVAEYKEFIEERQLAGESEERGETEITLAFRAKWFEKYPHFLQIRRGVFECCNRLEDYLADKADEEEAQSK